MANIIRLKLNWSGFTGGPGYTNLHFEPTAGGAVDQAVVDAAVTKTDAWLNSWRPDLPVVVSIGVNTSVEELDENTGNIQAFWTAAPAAPAIGGTAGSFAGGSGACVNWSTNDVRGTRRVRGRTFLVPISGGSMQADGTITDARLTAWRTATTTFIDDAAAARLVVWARPQVVPYIDGGAYNVTSFSINDKVAQLRSRRD